MSTNAIIRIEGMTNAQVYKHWDGYPEGTLPWLKKFNESFKKHRGSDPEYKMAQLLRDSVRSEDEYHLDKSEYSGWGVYAYLDPKRCGAEFVYTLMDDGSVDVEDIYGASLYEC